MKGLSSAFVGLVAVLFFFSQQSFAQYLTEGPAKQAPSPLGYLVAEGEFDDSYDPFSDYSEFDEASEEEADIHFFRNGRFFTVGFLLGSRGFTENLSSLYGSGATYGLYMSYFFDMRLAMQFSFTTGDYPFQLSVPNSADMTGNVSLTFMSVDLKYYFNTQNVTRGLADLNPYFIGGFSQVYRSYTLSGIDGLSRDATMGVDAGFGIEIPMMRRKAYFGIQGTYHYVNFKDENSNIVIPTTNTVTNARPKGDTYDILGILGLNF